MYTWNIMSQKSRVTQESPGLRGVALNRLAARLVS